MDQQVNPYHAPAAALDAADVPDITYPARFLSFRGRIDRMRYMGYASLGYLLSFAFMVTLAFVQERFLAQLNGSGAAYVIFFVATAVVLPLAIHAIYARRRLQDLGKSAWLSVLACIPFAGYALAIYLATAPGMPQPNEFGPRAKSGKSVGLWTLIIVPGLLLCLLINASLAYSLYSAYEMRQLAAESPVFRPRD